MRLSRTHTSTSLLSNTSPPLPILPIPRIPINIPLRHPILALPSFQAAVRVHGVNVLETERFGLEEEEVDHDGGEGVAAEEDEAEGVADAVVGEGREEGYEEVAQPVAGGG